MKSLTAFPGCLLVVVAALLVGGCEVPEIDSPAADADVSASAPQQPAATGAAGTAAKPPETPPAPSTAAPGPPPAAPSIADQRGLALEDWPDGFAYLLVKSDLPQVSAAIAELRGGRVVADAYGKPFDSQHVQTIVSQFAGHAWSLLTWSGENPDAFATELSGKLSTDVIMVAYSDFSGWQFVDIYRNGAEAEAFHWGLDYSEEGIAGPNPAEWDVNTQVTTNNDGISMTDQFFFRSKLRKATKEQIGAGDAFADRLLKEHEAYLPAGDSLVWLDEGDVVASTLGREAFAGVHVVLGP